MKPTDSIEALTFRNWTRRYLRKHAGEARVGLWPQRLQPCLPAADIEAVDEDREIFSSVTCLPRVSAFSFS